MLRALKYLIALLLINDLKPKTFLGADIGIRILFTEIMLFMPYAKVDTRGLKAIHSSPPQ